MVLFGIQFKFLDKKWMQDFILNVDDEKDRSLNGEKRKQQLMQT